MENPQEQQPENLRQLHQPQNHRRSHPKYHHYQQQQFQQNNNKDHEKKNSSRSRRYSKNRNHNHSYNDQSDGSVSTISSCEGSTNSWNRFRSQCQNNSSCSNSWSNSTSTSKKYNRNRRTRNDFSTQRDRQGNSMALNTYLRERGWSLSDNPNLKNNHNNHDGACTTINSNTNNTIILRESEMVRKRALKLLEITLCRWAASIEKNATAWQRVRVTLVTFGSYRLRAYRTDADVDLLALCPPSCTREDFFTSLVEMMESETAISHIHPIASAYTPVIKFTIHNIHFDMLFGRASGRAHVEKLVHYQRLSPSPLVVTDTSIVRKTGALGTATHAEGARGQEALVNVNTTATINNKSEGMTVEVLHEFTIEDSFLTGIEDDSEVRSANGVRVTQFIRNYVPYLDKFRLVLCAVKEWAMLHGIYSNVLGFLGGVNWAIMVAYVCKRHPNEPPSALLSTFFKIFATWNWPEPVMLDNANGTATGTTSGGMKPWDPKTNPRDARHVMPIITPVFPRMNSTYNIAISQQRRIQEELVRAAFLTQDESNWRALYNRSDFFERHANFLQITIRARNNPGEFTKWLRLCESRLRLLVNALDCPEMSVWPCAQLMERKSKPISTEATPARTDTGNTMPEALFFIALRFAPNVESIDLKHRTSEFLINHINSWEDRKPDMDLMIHHALQKDLPHQLIGKYVATKPSAYEIPNPMPFKPTSHENMTQNANRPSTTVTTTVTTSSKSRRSDTPPVPKDIRGPSGGDTQSVARSTYSSIARSMNSSMRSVDGTETSFDGIEPESRPLSPLGNFITVEGGPPTPRANDSNKKEQTIEGHKSGCDDAVKPYNQQAHLYEYLTGKIDDLQPVASADESCTQSIAAESQSDQSSTRSPIKKRPRNKSYLA